MNEVDQLKGKLEDAAERERLVTIRVSGLFDLLRLWRNACSSPDVRLTLLNHLTHVQRMDMETHTDRFLSGQGYDMRLVETLKEENKLLLLETASLRRELTELGHKPVTVAVRP